MTHRAPTTKAKTAMETTTLPKDGATTRSEVASNELVLRLRARSDNAYIEHLNRCGKTECLGWEAKVERGKFGLSELEAHKAAAEMLGRHRALFEAANECEEAMAKREAQWIAKYNQTHELWNIDNCRNADRIAALEDALRWALGEHETDAFRERAVNEGPYWWRKELRERSAMFSENDPTHARPNP